MRTFKLLLVLCGLLLFATQVHAIPVTLDPTTDILPYDWTINGNDHSTNVIRGLVAPYIGTAESLYKANFGGVEEGDLWDNYTTVFSNTSTNPRNALISHDGGANIGPVAWLIVKDGDAVPNWYLYNLTDLGWTGTETITLQNFFIDNPLTSDNDGGSISHVELLGTTAPVPEPATMLLFGAGLIGLAGFRRKFKK